jgi:hypothetical protein
MANHIEIAGSASRLNGKLAQLVAQATALQDDMSRLAAVMVECGATAATPDWVAVEAAFGLRAGEGTLVYALLNAAKQKINSADVDAFCNRLG